MKIIISYPPLDTAKGNPTLGQNRQFQYFKHPTHIYPMVPAWAATMLAKAGHQVIWNDCLAEGWDASRFYAFLQKEKPDLIAFETKTPVVKQHWRIIDSIKRSFLRGPVPKTVLFGDHVTAFPEESFKHSGVDFVLTGGDYDFLLVDLCDWLAGKTQNLQQGIYYRDADHIKNTGPFKLDHDLNLLPFIDRELTRWQLYAYKNGNYKRTPGTYVMSGRDCWWGRCHFCSWPTLYPQFRVRDVGRALDEVDFVISRYGVKEIMDDTGCFPSGEWLRRFCAGMVEEGYNKKVYIDCNMRFGAACAQDFALMKKANFRLLLFGLESAQQETLDRIDKNANVARIIEDCRLATEAGLYPHITVMFGYPWETYDDALKTLRLGQWLLRKGLAYTMQATIVIPYPGTILFKECLEHGWLKTQDWDDFDMKQSVMSSAIPDKKLFGLVRGMYGMVFHPEFLIRKLFSIEDFDDVRYYLSAFSKALGHMTDFK